MLALHKESYNYVVMKLDGIESDSPFAYKVTFTEEESFVMSAVYKERLWRLSQENRSKEAKKHETYLAEWEHGAPNRAILFCNPGTLTKVMRRFVADTDDRTASLPYETGIPAYINNYLAERIKLAERAGVIADTLEKAVGDYDSAAELIEAFTDGISAAGSNG